MYVCVCVCAGGAWPIVSVRENVLAIAIMRDDNGLNRSEIHCARVWYDRTECMQTLSAARDALSKVWVHGKVW